MGFLTISQVFADSIVFEQLIYCSFLQTVRVGVKKNWSFFCGCHKWMTPHLNDSMNLAVTQKPRDYDPGNPRITNKELIIFQVCLITWVFIQKTKQIGSICYIMRM